MTAIEITQEIHNKLSYAFSPQQATNWQLRVLTMIHAGMQMSEDTEELREKLNQAASQCQQAIAIMDRELGLEGKVILKTDKRKAG